MSVPGAATTGRATEIGIAGFGSIGRRHAFVAGQAGARIHVCDPAVEARHEAVHRGAVTTHERFDDLLACDLDALIVASPDRLHRPQVLAAADRGLPTLVEKPLAHSLDDGRELVEQLAGGFSRTLVGYVLRYCHALQDVKRLIHEGVLGEVASFHVQLGAYNTLAQARNRFDGGEQGTIYVDYSHEWDYLRWLLGPVVRGLAAERTVKSLPLVQTPNVVDGLLELESGCVGTFHLDYVQQPSVRSLTVVGAKATLAVDVPTGVVTVEGKGCDPLTSTFPQDRDELFRAQCDHLLAVAAGAEPRVTVDDGLAALSVAEGLRASAEGRGWVEIAQS